MKKVNIYCLIDPRTGSPFYVGATRKKISIRLSEHKTAYASGKGVLAKKYNFIRAMIKEGFTPEVKLLRIVEHEKSDHYEYFYIRKFLRKGFDLIQIYDRCQYQHIVTVESLAKRAPGYYDDLFAPTKSFIDNVEAK